MVLSGHRTRSANPGGSPLQGAYSDTVYGVWSVTGLVYRNNAEPAGSDHRYLPKITRVRIRGSSIPPLSTVLGDHREKRQRGGTRTAVESPRGSSTGNERPGARRGTYEAYVTEGIYPKAVRITGGEEVKGSRHQRSETLPGRYVTGGIYPEAVRSAERR